MLAPLTIAHAACKGHAPENTLAGVRAAIDLGVDAIEIDVHASRDGVPVLMHDATIERTTSGSGRVAELTLAELQAWDAGVGVFDGRFAGERIPTLAEVLDLTRRRCLLVIEVKQLGIAEQIAAVVRRMDAAGSAMVWSFHSDVVAAMRTVMPEVPAAQLWGGQSGGVGALLEETVRRDAQGVSVHHLSVEPSLVRMARLRGLCVFTWTADEPEDQARAAAAGVDGICTNVPDVLRTTLAQHRYEGAAPLPVAR
ncbi:MAG: glycerophosphodiester phosphodiesterase [Dehalococcoidia bacterium]